MDLFRSMHVFVKTVQEGSMTAAASQLFISPAMVGQHIAAIEDRLKVRLLNRTTRSQSLTDFGHSYFEQCRDILERVALTDLDAEALQSSPRGKLRITAPTTFGIERLIPALQRYRQMAPDVVLDVALTDRNVDIVEEGFDIAFRIGDLPDSRLVARSLGSYQMTIAASPDYLARRGRPSHPSQIAEHDGVVFTPAGRAAWKLVKQKEVVEVSPIVTLTVDNGQAVRRAARAGFGIIVQPNILLRDDIEAGRLVGLFDDWSLRERSVSLLYHRDRLMTPRMRSVIAFSLSEFAAL